MKKILTLISLILVFATVLSFASCDLVDTLIGNDTTETPDTGAGDSTPDGGTSDGTVDKSGAWANATYLQDTEFGNGAKTVQVEVEAEGQSITFTIKTDAETLGEALLAHGLIAGEQGAYGLYVKTVNGILADYDVDGTYWGFYKNGEMMMTGVDGAEISDGEHYELVKQK